jgi:hypothetical protein
VLGGNGTISGSVTSQGAVAPGNSPGTLNIGGSYTQQAGATLAIELASASSYDRLVVSGTASLAGTLAVSLTGGYLPAAGDNFQIITAAGFSNMTFTTVLPQLPENLVWNVDYATTSVTLAVAPAGLAGDFNSDGAVDAADYVVWRKGLGTTYTEDDYNDWRSNFGATQAGEGAGDSDPSAVPEPATVASLLASGILLLAFGRRR